MSNCFQLRVKLLTYPYIVILSTTTATTQNGMSSSLDLDLEQYVVPTPSTPVVYAANLTENPRSLKHNKESTKGDVGVSNDLQTTIKVTFLVIYGSDKDLNLKSYKVIYGI